MTSGTDAAADKRLSAAPHPLTGLVPTSVGQAGLWFVDQLDGGSTRYAMVFAYRFRGELAVPALEQAVNQVVARHGALRTTLVDVDGQPLQKIADELPVRLAVEDLPANDAALRQRLVQEEEQGFDLAVGPLFRATLLRLAEREHVLVLAVHHTVFDGPSLDILMDELRELYVAARDDRTPALEPSVAQYADFARAERKWLGSAECHEQVEFWRRTLDGCEPLKLPTDRPRSTVSSTAGDSVHVEVHEEATVGLDGLLADERVTPFMFLLAVHHVMLARWTGQRDVVVGSPMGNRRDVALRGAIGYFVNLVALRVDSAGDRRFRDLLRRVRDVSLDAYENQDYPYARLVAQLRAGRDRNWPGFFQTVMSFEYGSAHPNPWRGLEVTSVHTDAITAKFDLTVSIRRAGRGFEGDFTYRTALFDRSTIESLAADFVRILAQAVADPDTELAALLSSVP